MHQNEYVFDHERLDVGRVMLEAAVRGIRIAEALPRGYGPLADQLKRALQGAWLQSTEAIARSGKDRQCRVRVARAEAEEAAAALLLIDRLGIGERAEVAATRKLLARGAAMLTRMAALRR